MNISESLKGYMASLMRLIPSIMIPNPRMIEDTSLLFFALEKSMRIDPVKSRTGTSASTFIDTRNAVTVVPILAPMMIPVACTRFRSPEFTKPTTITVVAELDWMSAVTSAPIPTAFKGLAVTFSRMNLSFDPAAFSSPSPIIFRPYKKSPSPPSNAISILMSIFFLR